MTQEIERKFLVAQTPELLTTAPSTDIRQGYVALDGEVEVRLRDKGGRNLLTVKSGHGLQRVEVEVELQRRQFEVLWPATGERRVHKTRSVVDMGGIEAELDVFHDRLQGLVLVEVEFESEAAAAAFEPPPWFGREVTEDLRFANRNLALHGLPAD